MNAFPGNVGDKNQLDIYLFLARIPNKVITLILSPTVPRFRSDGVEGDVGFGSVKGSSGLLLSRPKLTNPTELGPAALESGVKRG